MQLTLESRFQPEASAFRPSSLTYIHVTVFNVRVFVSSAALTIVEWANARICRAWKQLQKHRRYLGLAAYREIEIDRRTADGVSLLRTKCYAVTLGIPPYI